MRPQLVELFKSSAIIQGTMALATLAVVLYLSATGQPIPDTLVGVLMATIGFYFGTKTAQRVD